MNHIAHILKDVHFNRKTGILMFRKDDAQKSLYFQDGNLIFTKTNVPDERLGEILFHMGKISEEAYRTIPHLLSPGSMLGETLLKKKFLSQQDLYDGLVAQMTAISLSLFPVFDAEISFRERGKFVDDSLDLKMNIPALIERGIREMPFHPSLKAFLENSVPVAKESENIQFLTDEEKPWLDLLDGRKDAVSLLALHVGSPEEFWKMLYLFDCLDVVVLRESQLKKGKEAGAERSKTDEDARLREAIDLLKRLPELNFHQILNVLPNADETEIKKAYFKLARKFHPDLFGRNLSPESKGQIDDVFSQITKAYRALISKEPRAAASVQPAGAVADVERDRSKNAEIRFRQGKTLFNQGRFEEAISLIEEATRLKDDKGDFYLLLALAQSRVPALSKKAEKNFFKSTELESWNPEGYVGLGLLYKKEGLLARAKKQFERALEIDPEHKTARQELRLLSQTSEGKKGLKGILTMDLFGSKKK